MQPDVKAALVQVMFTLLTLDPRLRHPDCGINSFLAIQNVVALIVDIVGPASFVQESIHAWSCVSTVLSLLNANLEPSDQSIAMFLHAQPPTNMTEDECQSLAFLRLYRDIPQMLASLRTAVRCLREIQAAIDCPGHYASRAEEMGSSHLFQAELELFNCIHILDPESLPPLRAPPPVHEPEPPP